VHPFDLPEAEADHYGDRRQNETREAFSRRVARWLSGGSPDDELRVLSLSERSLMMRQLALLSLELAEYRLKHGGYPEALNQLDHPIPHDSFGDGDIRYRRDDSGFTLWSVGFDGKDNAGKGDDIAIEVGN
jgi:hypothetical protein